MFSESAKIKMREVGRTIRTYRKAASIDQNTLAAKLNVSPMTVSRWERGMNAVSMVQWEALLTATFRPREPYPIPFHSGGDETPDASHVTKTVIDPALLAEMKLNREHLLLEVKGMRDSLPAAVREGLRDLHTILPTMVREAVREALRDSQSAIGELRDIKAQMAPTLLELKLVKDQVIVAVKEVLAEHKPARVVTGRSEHRKEKAPRDSTPGGIPSFGEAAIGINPLYKIDGVSHDARDTLLPWVWGFIDKHYREQYSSRNPIKYPVTHGAILRGALAGWAALLRFKSVDANAVGTDLTPGTVDRLTARDDVRALIAAVTEQFVSTKLKYAESKDSELTLRLAVVCGLAYGARELGKDASAQESEPEAEDEDNDLI